MSASQVFRLVALPVQAEIQAAGDGRVHPLHQLQAFIVASGTPVDDLRRVRLGYADFGALRFAVAAWERRIAVPIEPLPWPTAEKKVPRGYAMAPVAAAVTGGAP